MRAGSGNYSTNRYRCRISSATPNAQNNNSATRSLNSRRCLLIASFPASSVASRSIRPHRCTGGQRFDGLSRRRHDRIVDPNVAVIVYDTCSLPARPCANQGTDGHADLNLPRHRSSPLRPSEKAGRRKWGRPEDTPPRGVGRPSRNTEAVPPAQQSVVPFSVCRQRQTRFPPSVRTSVRPITSAHPLPRSGTACWDGEVYSMPRTGVRPGRGVAFADDLAGRFCRRAGGAATSAVWLKMGCANPPSCNPPAPDAAAAVSGTRPQASVTFDGMLYVFITLNLYFSGMSSRGCPGGGSWSGYAGEPAAQDGRPFGRALVGFADPSPLRGLSPSG